MESEPYTKFLQGEFERLSERPLESLYHDELGEVFTPLYFHQFMEQARQHDLQFLAEADFFDMVPRGLTPKAVEVLDRIGDDVVLREQYLDFMRGRHFRKTLLCHTDVPLNRAIKPDCVRSYYVSTFAKPESPAPSSEPGVQETFQVVTGAKLSTADPLARALFWYLVEKDPERIPFQRLAREVELRARQQFGFVPKPGSGRRCGHCRVHLGDIPCGPAGPAPPCPPLCCARQRQTPRQSSRPMAGSTE